MIINTNIEDLFKKGVYRILNKTTNKYYIGSTIMTFLKRLQHHISMLRANKHKNTYLQNAWNKYGEDDFEFQIIEICEKDNCLLREQYYLDNMECSNKDKSYNINPFATNVTCKESIEKRRQTMLRKYASGEFDYMKEILRNTIPWNKGKTYKSTEHLKVPKTKTKKFFEARNSVKEGFREKLPEVYMYNINYEYLGKFRSCRDLAEWSLLNNDLPNLQSVSISKSCRTNKTYKNLYFNYKPLHQVIDVEKQGELLENPSHMDNQQPSLTSNSFEGSTTNSQIQTDNAGDSNANTSTLQPIVIERDKNGNPLMSLTFVMLDFSKKRG